MATNDDLAQQDLISYENSYTGYELTSAGCALLFVAWVLWDVWKAFTRKAHWIPGQALVLSALSIQLLNFIDHLDVSINSTNKLLKEIQLIVLVEEQLVIDSRRVMTCVFIAYLLPGIVNSDLKTVWVKIGALAFTVILHMGYEVYFLLINSSETSPLIPFWNQWKPYRVWLMPSYFAITSTIILLVVLLSCAVIAGESIRKMMSQRVQLALSCCCNANEYRKCKNIEDHVLKSWIVVRVSQPDYVMARSEFSAFAGVVVAVCVVALVVKWTNVPHRDYLVGVAVYAIQFAFVVVGSIVVVFRWLTAVFCFPKDVRRLFHFEDFWTRNLVQQIDDLRGRPLLWSLRTPFLLVQKVMVILMVILSKVSWFLSEFVIRIIRPLIVSKKISDQFSKFEEVLEIMRMPGENADSLWRANQSAFLNTQKHFQKGIQNGKDSSKELIKLMEHKRRSIEDDAPTSLEEERHFVELAKKSWKLRAVSLIHLIIYFYDGTNSDVVTDCIKAYSQSVCFMDMVDRSDPEANLVSQAADKEFHSLENVWKKHLKIKPKEPNILHNQPGEAKAKRLLQEKIKNPLKENMEQLSLREERGGNIEDQSNPCMDKLHDSMDLMAVAAKVSLFKRWKAAIALNSDPLDAIYNLRCVLATIIFQCLQEELDKAVIQNCNKWAKDGNENEILNAALVAGKAKGVRQQIDEGKDRDFVFEAANGVEGEHYCTVEVQV